jgi:hypothetical protein
MLQHSLIDLESSDLVVSGATGVQPFSASMYLSQTTILTPTHIYIKINQETRMAVNRCTVLLMVELVYPLCAEYGALKESDASRRWLRKVSPSSKGP